MRARAFVFEQACTCVRVRACVHVPVGLPSPPVPSSRAMPYRRWAAADSVNYGLCAFCLHFRRTTEVARNRVRTTPWKIFKNVRLDAASGGWVIRTMLLIGTRPQGTYVVVNASDLIKEHRRLPSASSGSRPVHRTGDVKIPRCRRCACRHDLMKKVLDGKLDTLRR